MCRIMLSLTIILIGLLNCYLTADPTTTTAAPAVAKQFNFTIKKNNSDDACLKAVMAIQLDIVYEAYDENNKTVNKTQTAPLEDINGYNGTCEANLNTLAIYFWNEWKLELHYVLNNSKSDLDAVMLEYNIKREWFPNATNETLGAHNASASKLDKFQVDSGSSYKCDSETKIDLMSGVTVRITKYRAEPFFNKPENKDFDIAIDCANDNTGTSKLVPIIVGAALGFTVVLVLIAYLVGRHKHRSGYQSV